MMNIIGDTLRTVAWERDSLPDYLLICYHVRAQTTDAFTNLDTLINLVDDAAGITYIPDRTDPATTATFDEDAVDTTASESASTEPEEETRKAYTFIGQLTQFEKFTPDQRSATLAALDERDAYEALVPEDFAHVLGMYADAPGSWLLDPWRRRGLSVDPDRAQRVLSDLLTAAGPRRSPTAIWVKAFMSNRMAASGQASFGAGAGSSMRLLADWPNYHNEQQRGAAEATISSMFNALQMFDGSDESPQWAEKFWRSNWRLFPCTHPQVRTQPVPSSLVDDDHDGDGDARSYWRQVTKAASDAVTELRTEFQQLASTTDPDLYNPDRYEVLTGLVGRTLRYLDVLAAHPAMWTMEHGAPLLRTFVETRIVLRFLANRDAPELYAKFKAYGMGKLKLLKLQIEELIDESDDPPAAMVEYAQHLDALVNQDIMEEFQPIEVGGSFAGIDTRKMAAEVGMETEYRILFQPASSNVHGEWSIIDENVFVRCANPTHRRHRILSNDLDSYAGPAFLESILGHASALVAEYESTTAPQRRTII